MLYKFVVIVSTQLFRFKYVYLAVPCLTIPCLGMPCLWNLVHELHCFGNNSVRKKIFGLLHLVRCSAAESLQTLWDGSTVLMIPKKQAVYIEIRYGRNTSVQCNGMWKHM